MEYLLAEVEEVGVSERAVVVTSDVDIEHLSTDSQTRAELHSTAVQTNLVEASAIVDCVARARDLHQHGRYSISLVFVATPPFIATPTHSVP